MAIVFKPDTHSYISTDEDVIDWLSVTTIVGTFKDSFDSEAIAKKVSKNKKSKWYGIEPDKIQDIWQAEALRATDLGTFYHNQREADLCSLNTLEKEGCVLPVHSPIEKNGFKYAPEQRIKDGIYPEHLVYLKSAGICGQSDLVEVVNGVVNIIDYKSNKKIETESYVNWEGVSKKMKAPVNFLDDCSFNHYAIQLSIYMYIILKHNPKLKAGNIFIHHVTFEQEGEDEYGYPIYAKNSDGEPIVKDVIPIEVPYLVDAVISIINWLKTNRDKVKKK